MDTKDAKSDSPPKPAPQKKPYKKPDLEKYDQLHKIALAS